MGAILNNLSKIGDGVSKKSFRLIDSLYNTLISNFIPDNVEVINIY